MAEQTQQDSEQALREQARWDSSELKFHATQESILANVQQNRAYNEGAYSPHFEYESITYTNAYGQGIDMELTPHAAGIKENIILNQNPQDNRFASVITLPQGYSMELENGDIAWILDETGEKKAMIPDPFMVDSAMEEEKENLSYDITVTLTKRSDGTYLYMLEPSRAYLDDPDVVYPVKIDPNITLMTPDVIQDTDVCNTSPTRNYYTTANLRVGRDTDNNVFRSLLRFNMPAELNGKYIRLLSLGTYQAYNGASSPEHYVQQLTTNWSSSTATWQNQPGYGIIYERQTITGVKRYYWNLRHAVRSWLRGDYPNYGVAIISSQEGVQRYKRYYSSDAPQEPIHFGIDYAETDFTATVTGKGASSSKCDITVNLPYIPYEDWDPYFYFNVHMAKQNADGSWGAFEPQGPDNGCVDAGTTVKTISNVDADGRARKIRVLYKNDYGICNTVDKIVQIPDLTPPQISGAVTARDRKSVV